MANDLVPFAPSPKLGDLENFADCFKAAKLLQKGDDAGVNTILKRAAELGLSGIQVEMLIVEIHARTRNSKRMLKKAFQSFVKIVAEEKAEAKKKAAADAADQWRKMRDEERERLWKSCRHIAEHPDLLEAMEEIAHQLLGVVNEGAAVQAGYLTCMSRHLVGEAIRYLRTGASASGKNYPVEKVFQFIFRDDVIHISGASAKAIAYFGGQDAPDALKHKILYIPEADILARKQGDSSNEVATMLRTLISEGVLVHQTVVTDPMTGRRETETIVKNGPIAVILTTADDVDDQLKTRALIMGTDESGEQTEAIVERILSDVGRKPVNLQPWNDFDLWLRIDAPYRVEVPFAAAVSKAFKMSRPGFLQAASMRMRRDADSFLTAVKASAATHKAQRKTTEDGAIIATLDDYQHALKAFDGGLATAHGHTSEAVISVVAAVEEMLKEEGVSDLDPKPDSPSVKVAVRDLCKRLRIASTSTAKERLDEAVTVGALEYDDTKHGGRGRPRYFRVLKTAAELRAEPHGGVFPSLDEVRNFFRLPLMKPPNRKNSSPMARLRHGYEIVFGHANCSFPVRTAIEQFRTERTDMSATAALVAAKKAGVRLTLDAPDGIILEVTPPARLPADIVAQLKAVKPDLMRILEWREAAKAASLSEPPPDCGLVWTSTGIQRFVQDGEPKAVLIGVRESAWALALQGLKGFILSGWGDQACLLGWTAAELYRVPPVWARVDLCGAALLIGDRRVLAVTGDNIVVATRSGSTLKFRRIGREHLA